jgi:hypothetical protein
MVVVGKTETLLQLAKGDGNETGKQLLRLLLMVDETLNPLNTDPEKLVKLQTKLRKNAFALINKQKYKEAAATFLLCPTPPMIRSAASVLSKQLDDPFLAHLVTRIIEYRYVQLNGKMDDVDMGLKSTSKFGE